MLINDKKEKNIHMYQLVQTNENQDLTQNEKSCIELYSFHDQQYYHAISMSIHMNFNYIWWG